MTFTEDLANLAATSSAEDLASLAADLQDNPDAEDAAGPTRSFASFLWEAYEQMHERRRDEVLAFTGFNGIEQREW